MNLPRCRITGISVNDQPGVRHVADLLCARHLERTHVMHANGPTHEPMNPIAKYALGMIVNLDGDADAQLLLDLFTKDKYIRSLEFHNNWSSCHMLRDLKQFVGGGHVMRQMRSFRQLNGVNGFSDEFKPIAMDLWETHTWIQTLSIKYHSCNSISMVEDQANRRTQCPFYTTPPAAPLLWAAAFRDDADTEVISLMANVERYRAVVTLAANMAVTQECRIANGATKFASMSALLVSILHPLMAALAHDNSSCRDVACGDRIVQRIIRWAERIYQPCNLASLKPPSNLSIAPFSKWTRKVMAHLTSHLLNNVQDFAKIHKLSRVGGADAAPATDYQVRTALGHIHRFIRGHKGDGLQLPMLSRIGFEPFYEAYRNRPRRDEASVGSEMRVIESAIEADDREFTHRHDEEGQRNTGRQSVYSGSPKTTSAGHITHLAMRTRASDASGSQPAPTALSYNRTPTVAEPAHFSASNLHKAGVREAYLFRNLGPFDCLNSVANWALGSVVNMRSDVEAGSEDAKLYELFGIDAGHSWFTCDTKGALVDWTFGGPALQPMHQEFEIERSGPLIYEFAHFLTALPKRHPWLRTLNIDACWRDMTETIVMPRDSLLKDVLITRGAAKVTALGAILTGVAEALRCSVYHEVCKCDEAECKGRMEECLRTWINELFAPCDQSPMPPRHVSHVDFLRWTSLIMAQFARHVLETAPDLAMVHELSRIGVPVDGSDPPRKIEQPSHEEVREALTQICGQLTLLPSTLETLRSSDAMNSILIRYSYNPTRFLL